MSVTTKKPATRIGIVAVIAAVASIFVGPTIAASASIYQDLYSRDCGAKVVQINDSSRGVATHHYRNGSLTAVWNNANTTTYFKHASAPLKYKSVSSASVETGGTNANVLSASTACV